MPFSAIVRKGSLLLALLVCLAPPVSAQIEDQIAAYTGANAKGYLQPLAKAIGSDFNSGIFRSASIPHMRPTLRLEILAMSAFFGDDDQSFRAVTEQGFSPKQYASAPTVVGSEKALLIEGDGGTTYAFPGGFDLHSFALAVPQLRVGGIFGTEAIFRYFAVQIGNEDIGDLSLFGFGLKHSISQYVPAALPVDLSAGFFWQRFSIEKGEESETRGDFIESNALSIGVQASRKLAFFLVPYTGLSYDTHSMDVSYETGSEGEKEAVDVHFDKTGTMRFTLGLMLNLPGLNAFGEFNLASQSSIAFGVGLGF
ncbi:MAG: autotransporter domain-containing protein [Candidatus Krumholzibacteria bacterium]|nr:autotransporter domain-containing protein [Candidatus Krumholzibacteria bacterium]